MQRTLFEMKRTKGLSILRQFPQKIRTVNRVDRVLIRDFCGILHRNYLLLFTRYPLNCDRQVTNGMHGLHSIFPYMFWFPASSDTVKIYLCVNKWHK